MEAVKCLKVVLEQGLSPGAGRSDSTLLDTLQTLKTLGTLSLRVVGETGLGKVISQLSRDVGLSNSVRSMCKDFVLEWKEQLERGKAERSVAGLAGAPAATPAATAATPAATVHAKAALAQAPAPTGARWTPPPVKAAPPPAAQAPKAGAAAAPAAAPRVPLPTPADVLRQVAAESAPPRPEDIEDVAPKESKDEALAKEIAAAAVRVRTEFESGEQVFTCTLEIKSQLRRVLAPFRKTKKRAELDEKLVRIIAGRLPESEGVAWQWRTGSVPDPEIVKLLKDLPKDAPAAARGGVRPAKGSGSTPPKAKRARKAKKQEEEDEDEDEDDDGEDGEEEEGDDDDEESPKKRGKAKAKGKAAPKKLAVKLKRGKEMRGKAKSRGKGTSLRKIAFKKKRLGG